MYRLASLLVLCCILMVNGANADRDIVLLHGEPSKVVIDDEAGTIRITDGDPNTFVFECFDPELPNDPPANIEFIGLSGSPSGTITVSILPGEGHTYGAASIWEVDLTDDGDDVTGVIDSLLISGSVATMGNVDCDSITGTVDIDIDGDPGMAA